MCKLIMIDDNPMEHMILQKMFDRYDLFHDAMHALDGRDIIKSLIANQNNPAELPDLIFLDLNMPHFSGFDFLEQFNSLQPSIQKTISIYIVSSSIDEKDKSRVFAYPYVKEFLTKPVKKDQLEQIYTAHFKIKRIAG